MLISFKNVNVGPMADRELKFAPHLNVFTGDNSLGKSFLLDMLWFGLTRQWPHDLNPKVDGGFPARPREIRDPAKLTFDFKTMTGRHPDPLEFSFRRGWGVWKTGKGRKAQPGLVVYAMSDGSFAVWDPIRNYWSNPSEEGQQARPPAYVLARSELWPSAPRERSEYCKGVIEGWASWQNDKDERLFKLLKEMVCALIPEKDGIEIGEVEKVPDDEGGNQPTLRFPYGTIRLQYASSAVRRMASLAYVLVWAISQHLDAARNRGMDTTHNVILLFDEIEAHLHPRWQRSIIKGVLDALPKLCDLAGLVKNELQMFVSTHSPLVMSALEDEFYCEDGQSCGQRNKWFDFDLNGETRQVEIEEPDFNPRGTAESWLTSRAFDLDSTYSPEVEKLLDEARRLAYSPEGEINCAIDCNCRLKEIVDELRDRMPLGNAWVRRLAARLEETEHAEN